ncbi:MAG: hypothetical protein UR66_C0008G0017 [Candidatus Moranbacteria bacterium GW2011_GWE1_35_17]|nr:MAG: hypothetical protein UR66_C0008G0017 [Candidatus Moranbacteria bacterium GW2011_GWE1_35_17]KKP71599.1 MAG: hypothetical protein UR65_C0030G0008 [Candidatus Moranbacteria bacterium GW2011_GWE2_35_164]KKP80787.1 MAG: hypothetical protein UR82_C0082G0008 [Candidatus Moranbacteria bacterium GW2011_GWF1_35_5]KKP84298.1 MAG: hypothetical protein UR83_C0024G0027 [Candidatus Moranbacteria bacterium GW2011_GWF2_35_54]
MEKETLVEKSTEISKKEYEITEEESSLDNKFISFLRCNNKNCREISIASGSVSVDSYDTCDCYPVCDHDCVQYERYVNYYKIEYLNPAVNIIEISNNIPNDIKILLKESFFLFWCSPSSAANKVRGALELIMDEQKIDSKKVNKKGEEYILSLHSRLIEFGKVHGGKYEELSKILIGIKWLLNAGSHKGEIDREDLLDAYDVLNHVLFEIFLRENQKLDVADLSNKLKNKFSIR